MIPLRRATTSFIAMQNSSSERALSSFTSDSFLETKTTSTYARTYVRMYVGICTCVHKFTSLNTHKHIMQSKHNNMQRTHTQTRMYTYVRTYICTHKHTYVRTYQICDSSALGNLDLTKNCLAFSPVTRKVNTYVRTKSERNSIH